MQRKRAHSIFRKRKKKKMEAIRKYFAYGGKWHADCYIPAIHDHFYYDTMIVTVTGEFRGMRSIHDYIIQAFDINELTNLVEEAQETNIRSVVVKAIGTKKDIQGMLERKNDMELIEM